MRRYLLFPLEYSWANKEGVIPILGKVKEWRKLGVPKGEGIKFRVKKMSRRSPAEHRGTQPHTLIPVERHVLVHVCRSMQSHTQHGNSYFLNLLKREYIKESMRKRFS